MRYQAFISLKSQRLLRTICPIIYSLNLKSRVFTITARLYWTLCLLPMCYPNLASGFSINSTKQLMISAVSNMLNSRVCRSRLVVSCFSDFVEKPHTRYELRNASDYLIRYVKVRICVLHVVVVFKGLHQGNYFPGGSLITDRHSTLRHH